MTRPRTILIWGALGLAMAVPLVVSLMSPLLAWREPIYIAAGAAGVVGLVLLLVQPLLAAGLLPGLSLRGSRRVHNWIGGGLVVAILVHVGGLWITSPPDVVDALLFRSPTPFSAWGVIAMWAAFAAGLIAALRKWLRWRPMRWRMVHASLAGVVVVGTVVHALLIEGTMELLTKVGLCTLVILVMAKVAVDMRASIRVSRRKA